MSDLLVQDEAHSFTVQFLLVVLCYVCSIRLSFFFCLQIFSSCLYLSFFFVEIGYGRKCAETAPRFFPSIKVQLDTDEIILY